MAEKIDLHTHTTASDGSLTPPELVDRALSLGFSAIAITDHDTVSGVLPACVHAEKTPLTVIPGVEMGAQYTGEMHILGLGVDSQEPVFLSALAQLRDARKERNRRMVEKLQGLGLPVSWADIAAGHEESVIGRAHMAHALIQNGVVPNLAQAFEKYLGEGKKAYVERMRFTPSQTIDLIHQAGGLSVLAHPVQLELDEPALYAVCKALKDRGLWGIEAYHPMHSNSETAAYCRLARRLGLMITGGSDFHGLNKPDVELGDSVVQCAELEKAMHALKAVSCRRNVN
ncbi:MAG: PHP domain-containing protein [Bacillota bacterium]